MINLIFFDYHENQRWGQGFFKAENQNKTNMIYVNYTIQFG
jgi:hypothetical protein